MISKLSGNVQRRKRYEKGQFPGVTATSDIISFADVESALEHEMELGFWFEQVASKITAASLCTS
jgi:hypothetical protein